MTSRSLPQAPNRDRADYGLARAKDLAFDAVSTLWRRRRQAGLKQTDIAATLDRDPAWVNRALRGPGNWTLRTFGELVEALGGEIEIHVHDLSEPASVRLNYDAYADYAAPLASATLPIFAQSSPIPATAKSLRPVTTTTLVAAE